ncbi:4Fe-4S binding protein [Lachnospiraceae bacterium ASD4241]|uniref:4Fe-4S binding protein n=2 Tax=Diplocloster modestus TaxID=2850322 RepID=A0ABS6KEH1_9FIRM|nr:4Fe-4S binding protein [Diplocloster modestus]MBU9728899.1 4Fe-4S binding protein [Diplocloster modestus]
MEKQQDMPTSTPAKRRVLGPCSHILVAAHTGSWRMERPQVEEEACIRCGICSKYCPTACITVNKEGCPLEFDWHYCKGCGICANECPRQALSMIPEGSGE